MAPLAFGTNAASVVFLFLLTFSSISAASANCGIALGETNEDTSILGNPASIKLFII